MHGTHLMHPLLSR